MTETQFWLAELDQYGNPTLVDGAHSKPEDVQKARFLIESMKLGKPNRKFAIAKVELSECLPSNKGVNMDAVRTIRGIR